MAFVEKIRRSILTFELINSEFDQKITRWEPGEPNLKKMIEFVSQEFTSQIEFESVQLSPTK